ncbi:hypothetical protein J437_LFUL008732 [Ladona fulva]|uniref:Transposable element P transposase-like RNase H domain-containing protein n=1 Tax=Ladona fulva TaxID=123851 RepID=A0A8K0K5N1_LADFU|nr:hypothetical protein J437_LFUL008732 [Ladona fulva]
MKVLLPSVCLSIDDMCLKEHVEFDGEKIIGYVDMGLEIENDSLPTAKMACIIMCTSINAHWKIPCGYFFADYLSSSETGNLVIGAIEKLHELGVNVTALTFDGAAVNLAIASYLGANIVDASNLQVFPLTHSIVART